MHSDSPEVFSEFGLEDIEYIENMLKNVQMHFLLCDEEGCDVCKQIINFFKEIEDEL